MSTQLHSVYTESVRKYVYEILTLNYLEHDEIIIKLCHGLPTKKEIEQLSKLIHDVHNQGYRSAEEHYNKRLKAMGFDVEITPEPDDLAIKETKPSSIIFK